MLFRVVATTAALALLSVAGASAQTPTFNVTPYPNNLWADSYGLNGHIKADLNGDGLEDFVSAVTPSFSAGCSGAFALTLSKGDGTYAAPVCYDIPSGNAIAFAAADFNGSGNIGLVVANDQGDLYWFMNTGQGVLQYRTTATAPATPAGLIAMDVNHDGNADLVFDIAGPSTTNVNSLYVLFGYGDGSFRNGPVTNFTLQRPESLQLGDFDQDNKPDVMVQGAMGALVLYGDDQGNFTPSALVGGSPIAYNAVDISGNGATDLVGTPLATTSGRGPTTYFKHLDIQYGKTNRTFVEQYVYLKSCTPDFAPPSVADLNGDGINDIVVIEAADCTGAAPWTVNVMLGKGDGTYQPEQILYTLSTVHFYETHILRANRDTKPGIMFFQSTPAGDFQDLGLNTTVGNFPKCNPPAFGYGINICAPTSTTGANSPVTFSFGASNPTLGRDFEIWVDGTKVADQLKHAFSNYEFVDASVPLSAGTHKVDLYGKAWDATITPFQTFSLTVGSDECPKWATGIDACSPIRSSTVSSPVLVYARGMGDPSTIVRMEVWVDGVKKYSTFGTDVLKTQLTLAPGVHNFVFYQVNTNGQIDEQTTQTTVQ